MVFKNDRQRKGFFAQLKGLRGRFERAQERRILAKTKKEERKLSEIEIRLGRRIKVETSKQERLTRVAEERLALEKIKVKEREAKAEIAKFTLAGKARGFLQREAREIGEKVRARREFLRTPEGLRQTREKKERRARLIKKFKKIKLV